MFSTERFFDRSKLTVILDGGAGSSGKGKLGSFICHHAGNWQFACNTFMPQAGHWVKLDDGSKYFYQTFNSCAYLADRYEKLYIGPGSTIELAAFRREMQENRIKPEKIGISPVAAILQDIDQGFERGMCDFDGTYHDRQDACAGARRGGYLAKTGTTAHGCGANRARRVLRRPEAKYARDIPELQPYLCDVSTEIMDRLDRGQAGLLEIAQGFQLSYMLAEMFPFTTSRNCTVAAGMDDMMLPVHYAGQVILNFRTYPIRINSNKYLDKKTGNHLTWDELKARTLPKLKGELFGQQLITPTIYDGTVEIVQGNSGPGYPDQTEITWDELTAQCGSPEPIMEMTSVTKLPRRVFTFSRDNLSQAIRHNKANDDVHVSINFMNYVDWSINGARSSACDLPHVDKRAPNRVPLPPKVRDWLDKNVGRHLPLVRFLGTGEMTDDMIMA